MPIALASTYDQVSCVSDDDWFVVQGQGGEVLKIALQGWTNGYEIGLAVFAKSNPSQQLAYFPKYDDTVHEFPVPSTGDYLLRVKNVKGIARQYSLSVSQ